jgi:T-complex protein 1 subunit eta
MQRCGSSVGSLLTSWLLRCCCALQFYGVDVNTGGVVNTFDAFVWEPALVKLNAIQSATEAACLILSVDETVKNPRSDAPDASMGGGRGGGMRGRGRGRGMMRR